MGFDLESDDDYALRAWKVSKTAIAERSSYCAARRCNTVLCATFLV